MDGERESHPSSVCTLSFTPKPHKPGNTRVRSEELGGGGGLLSELEGRATQSHSNAYVGGMKAITQVMHSGRATAKCGFIRPIYSITATERQQCDCASLFFAS